MLELRKIAVTGSLGSGKSLTCKLFSELGACIISTDELVRQLLTYDEECIQKVEALLGPGVAVDHRIDRKKVADLVFPDRGKLDQLEKILHPLVFKKMEQLYRDSCRLKKCWLFVVEVPLLFEVAWEFFFDKIVMVTADEDLCRKRSLDRGLSLNEYMLRSARFLPCQEKLQRADFIVYNDTTLENLKKQVVEIVKKIKK